MNRLIAITLAFGIVLTLAGQASAAADPAKGFKFSPKMKKAAIVWDDKTLDQFIAKPRKMVKGTRMAFSGIKKAADRANLIAYLKKVTK